METMEILAMAGLGAVLGGAWATWYTLHRVAFWQERADQLARRVSDLEDRLLHREMENARLARRIVELGMGKP